MLDANAIKRAVPLADYVGRIVDWDPGKSSPGRGDLWACCPLHDERTPSFHVKAQPAPGVWYCQGCQAGGSVIDFVQALHGLTYVEALRHLAEAAGIDGTTTDAERDRLRADAKARQDRAAVKAHKLALSAQSRARRLWVDCDAHDPAPVAAYLAARGIDVNPLGGIPARLRYHPDLPCYAGEDEQGRARLVHSGPAMVAVIGRRVFRGVHRTWITPTGRAVLSDGTKVPKKWLGLTGALWGEPVALTPPRPRMIVGEGIETTLAVLSLENAKGNTDLGAETALSLGALAGPEHPAPDHRPGWLPADDTEHVDILADPSAKNPANAEAMAKRAAAKLNARGLSTALRVPLNRWDHNEDFADLAKKGTLT